MEPARVLRVSPGRAALAGADGAASASALDPNREVRQLYTSTFRSWMAAGLRARGGDLEALLSALLAGDAEGLAQQLEAFVENALSYHDIPLRAPEQVYQAFIVGLLAALEGRDEVRSNREAGRGHRC